MYFSTVVFVVYLLLVVHALWRRQQRLKKIPRAKRSRRAKVQQRASLYHQLTDKPWLTHEDSVIEVQDRRAFAQPAVRIGLRVLLAVITILFLLLVAAYIGRMMFSDWNPLHDPWLLWLNTAILIVGSVALQRAVGAADRDDIGGVSSAMLVGGVFSFSFVIGQLVAWQELVGLGFYASTNPSVGFFYLLTAMHGVHILGGLVAWTRTMGKIWQGFDAAKVRLSVELCAVYWHFLLVVWLVLFALLLYT